MSNETVDRVIIGVFATYTDAAGIVRTAHRGEVASLPASEAERLEGLGMAADLGGADTGVERQRKLDQYRAERGDADAVAAISRAVAPTEAIPDVTLPQPSVSPPGLGGAPVGEVLTGDTGGPDTPPPVSEAPGGTGASLPRADAPDVAESDAAALAAWIEAESPNVGDTVALAEGDPALAAKVLEAESLATGGDPRAGVEKGLRKITGE